MKPIISWPLCGPHNITFGFGEVPKWYTDAFGYPHNGIDIACPIGTEIKACDNGLIIFADKVPDKDGMGIILAHSWGISLYWHLSVVSAWSGKTVLKTNRIGFSGQTGFATGPHLHFGIKVFGESPEGMLGWSNPLDYVDNTPQEPAIPQPVDQKYLVLPGDNLWKIAVRYYGDGTQWPRIYNANKDKIANPRIIRAFQILYIP
jgi:murein DD-endopeptidase MepM/ murein hydrolase activator NlpD